MKGGGYTLLTDCLAGKRALDELIKLVSDAGLRGLGGAGFPTGRKWQLVRAEPSAAPVRGQCRRRRARHLQGPFLFRTRSAPLHRGHADRGLGGRGGGNLSLHPRRISRAAADAGRRNRQGRGCRIVGAHQAASAPRRRRLHLRRRVGDDRVRSRASAACRATARLMSRRSACSAARRWSRMSRRSTGCATSSKRAPPG